MKKLIIYFIFSISLILFISGCGVGPQKHYSSFIEESIIDLDYHSILLMNVKTNNAINAKHYLVIRRIEFEKNGEKIIYECTGQNTNSTMDSQGYVNNLVFVPLEPGNYKLNLIKGKTGSNWYQSALSGYGLFQLPIFIEFEVQPNKISYIGRIDAIMREKQDNDFSAGPATPLVHQSESGVAKGTFDISIIDEFSQDLLHFSSVYPHLKDQLIEKQILSEWKRPSKKHYAPPKTHFGFWNN